MKERIITAICLLAIGLPLVFLGGWWFIILGLLATIFAIYELLKMHDQTKEVLVGAKLLTFFTTMFLVFIPSLNEALFVGFLGFILVLILNHAAKNFKSTKFHLFIIPYIGLSFRALLEIRSQGLALFIFLIATVILTDSGAYFVGKFFGKRKLAPVISPNKTVEGALGGWFVGFTFAIIFGISAHLFNNLFVLLTLAIMLPILSQCGDLLASYLKRKYGIKDYGNLFPGHGGIMDRVDSQLLAAIILYIAMQLGGIS